MTQPLPLPRLVIRALERASTWHDGQWRRHPTEKIPYIAHPATVGFLLQRAGYSDEIIAAGILHDVIEDCGVTKEEIAAAFSPEIAELVAWLTEPTQNIETWKERKDLYRQQLTQAPDEALIIKAADCVANLTSLLDALEVDPTTWSMFYAGREEKMAHEQAVLDIVSSRIDAPLVALFRELHERVMQLP